MGDSSQHSKRSPSGYDWWGNCPGAPDYCEKLGLTREGGPAAQWGTMVHGIGEESANYILQRGPQPPVITDAQVKEVVEFYIYELFNPEEPLCDCPSKHWIIGVEEKGNSPHLPHSSGTMDFVASCPVHLWLRVADLKTGHGEVEAQDNGQCGIYGVQALLSGKHRANKVVVEIIQPRSPSGRRVKRWTLSALELLEMLPVFQRKVAASLAPDAPLVAGEKQCKYCPAAAVCPERRKAVLRAAQLQFNVPAVDDGRVVRHSTYTMEDLAEAKRLVPQLLDWCKSVDSIAYQEANNGAKIPGFKLVQKRDGNRKWKDEEHAYLELPHHFGVNPDDLVERKVKSPAQVEKLVGTAGTAKEVIDSLCTREPGGTVLVEDTDNRPAVVVDKLATFQHLLTK